MTDYPEPTYRKMVKHFADGRKICNCGEAWYTAAPTPRDAELYGDYYCAHGCSSNQIAAKYELVHRLAKLGGFIK